MAPARSPKRKGGKGAVRDESVPIMETNDSSIVSKRSVEQKFYPEPHFLRYFVKKRKNRSPLINRGYWLRMRCIEHTVRSFCRESSKPSVVINLGAGFDALPFRLLSVEPELCESTLFIDVDYEQLLRSKIDMIMSNKSVFQPLLGDSQRIGEEDPVIFKTNKYWALSCDLHGSEPLKNTISKYFNDGIGHRILFVSEVATCYMEPENVDALHSWASGLEDATFCLLEQHLPHGPDFPFASTMLRHFQSLNSPLRGMRRYVSISDQDARFQAGGWKSVRVDSLWDVWCDTSEDAPVSQQDRHYLNSVETFDEWEELALFACHYFLLVARSRPSSTPNVATRTYDDYRQHDAVTCSLSRSNENTNRLQMPHRRFGALFQTDPKRICCHGGMSTCRTNSTLIFSTEADATGGDCALPTAIEARMCHTITLLNNRHDLLLIGGRASPQRVFSDCWLRSNGSWTRAKPLPTPLYRHCSLKVNLGHGNTGVLVYGGRTAAGSVSRDAFLWTTSASGAEESASGRSSKAGVWHTIEIRSPFDHVGRFAAMMESTLGAAHGILIGGLLDGGIPAMDEALLWTLVKDADQWIIDLIACERLRSSADFDATILNRFGASMVPCHDGFVILGGISRKGILRQVDNVVHLHAVQTDKTPITLELELKRFPKDTLPLAPPLLVGHSSIWNGDHVVVAGGGAICFSFGTYYTNEVIQIFPDGQVRPVELRLMDDTSGGSYELAPEHNIAAQPTSDTGQDGIPTVRAVRPADASEMNQIMQCSKPVLLPGLEFGACTSTWTPTYLVQKIGAQRKVTIHRASTSDMAFQPGRKNFQYLDTTFGHFIDSITSGGKEYLRALSTQDTSTPANLANDFPEISTDFRLPDVLESVSRRMHSSVLRISGPVSMWLHYDVLANVLVQIRGTKTLMLFPPSDICFLDVPPGSSSSRLGVSSLLARQDSIIRQTHPKTVVLSPGDALFLPPLWLHCAHPNDGLSVAVNVFFRDLDEGYAPGRDTYGNRDLQAYEDGRKDLIKIFNRFKGLPAPVSDFYLKRLSMELQKRISESSSLAD